jgi:AhpD family alkylhydroperoxidase
MYATMANAPALLKTYIDGYRIFREETLFSAIEQEVLFLTISRYNRCDYCMAAHSMIADSMSRVPTEVTDATRNGDAVDNSELAALVSFTEVMLNSHGIPLARDVESFLAAGHGERHILEIIIAIAVKTLSKYSNHLLNPALDEIFANREWHIYAA